MSVFGSVLVVARRSDATVARPLAGFALLSGILVGLAPEGTWPLPPLVALAIILLAAPGPRRRWLARGRIDRWSAGLTASTALLAPLALAIWFAGAGDPSGSVLAARGLLQAMPTWLLPVVGLAFALTNAFVEEIVYRGILQVALQQVSGSATTAVAGQAVIFGLAHLHGFPSGSVGVALATAYGLALGILRVRTGGLLAPWLTHVVADLTIFSLIVVYLV